MNRKWVFLVLVLVLILTACNMPARTSNVTGQALNTPTSESPLPAVSSPQIVEMQMLDASNGWAITATQVLRTKDGGITWLDVTPVGVSQVGYAASYFFEDIELGWLVIPGFDATSGTLYHTTDGGHSWISFTTPFGNPSLDFVDSSKGWALVGLGAGMSHEAVAVFRTSDAGKTWNQVFTDDPTASNTSDSLPFVGDKNGIVAISGNQGWVTGSTPQTDFIYLYMTRDGGVTWTHQDVSFPPAYAGGMAGVSLPQFFNGTDGVLPVGLYFDTPGLVFYTSTDAGQTWTASTPVTINGKGSIVSPTQFFAWDGGSNLYTSADAGLTWSKISPNIDIKDILVSFQFVDAKTGWAVTGDANDHHSLYKTLDGGATWTVLIP